MCKFSNKKQYCVTGYPVFSYFDMRLISYVLLFWLDAGPLFVAVVGEIHSISDNHDSAKSDLHVSVSRMIRQRYRVVKDLLFGNDPSKPNDQTAFQNQRSQRDHFLIDHRQSNRRVRRGSESSFNQELSPGYNLSILVPGKCQIRQGKGVFLFMGSIRLRRARLYCAPRLVEFHQIWNAAVAAGTNPCTIKYLWIWQLI